MVLKVYNFPSLFRNDWNLESLCGGGDIVFFLSDIRWLSTQADALWNG